MAVIAGSGAAAALNALGADIATVADVADVPHALPLPTLPLPAEVPGLLIPALSLAFVGLVQGAAISAAVPNPDGTYAQPSRDFIGQGAGNVASGVFHGVPVGGSMSATSLVVAAGARSRLSLLVAAAVMALVIVFLAGVIQYVAMPVLAALLIVAGVATIKPDQIVTVGRAGPLQLAVLTTTFALTMVMPVQHAVLVGVAMSIILHVARQSSGLTTRQLVLTDDGRMREQAPPGAVAPGEVVVLQPYGSLFFATVHALEDQLPTITPEPGRRVVILRLRGVGDVGATLNHVLARYAQALRTSGGRLMLISDDRHLIRRLRLTGAMDAIGEENVLRGTEWVGDTVRAAHRRARRWAAGDEDDQRHDASGR